jgi:hypothetical protein
VSHEDPERTRFLELREVWYCDGDEPGTFILVEAHGWWNNEKKESSRQTTLQRLGQYKTESDISKAMDEEILWLRGKGWIHKRIGECRYNIYWTPLAFPIRADYIGELSPFDCLRNT